MNYANLARFFRLLGQHAEETPHGVWNGVGHGFFLRVPSYEVETPGDAEARTIFGKHKIVGLKFSAPPDRPGKPSHIYFCRNRGYDIPLLAEKERRKTRRGLENCAVRQMEFDELHRAGMPLNLDTLNRQQRDEPLFSNADQWRRLCAAGAQVEGAQAWGSFVGDQLATYTILFQIGRVMNIVYTMSRTELMNFHSSPALTYSVTRTLMTDPNIDAVCYGPEGLSGGDGLDEYKVRMGYVKEPVTFAVRLRPVVKTVLLNPASRGVVSALNRWRPHSDVVKRVQSILDIAAAS